MHWLLLTLELTAERENCVGSYCWLIVWWSYLF